LQPTLFDYDSCNIRFDRGAIAMSLELVVIAGTDKGRTFTLNVGPDLMLGRSAQAQYQLNDPRVSRNHCQVLLDGDKVSVRCNGGSGGTLVNGQKVQQHTLKPGDVLQVGDTQLRFQVGDMPLDVALAQSAGAKKAAEPAKAAGVENLSSLVGQTLAHYSINMVIGTGHSSVVFHATDTKDTRPVALKVLHPDFSTDEEEKQRFIRAIKTMLPLRHPNLITLYAAGKTGKHCWVAMEYVAGENLTQVIGRIGVAGMLDWKHAFRVAVHIGRALEYAHGEGIIHRNVTPTNILIDATSKSAKLGDLMLAKALETTGPQITRPGEIIGDVAYMSPERTRGSTDLDGRSDLYGLGATLYALLTGRPPFTGATLVEKITRIRQTEPEKPTKLHMGIPSAFEAVVLKLLAKEPSDRHQTATDLLKELGRIGRFNGVKVE
jgi:pSer/pThr/pTyr-binding forkhead associated (FHA) protein